MDTIVQYTYNNYSTLVVYLSILKRSKRSRDNVCPCQLTCREISQYELWWEGVANADTMSIQFETFLVFIFDFNLEFNLFQTKYVTYSIGIKYSKHIRFNSKLTGTYRYWVFFQYTMKKEIWRVEKRRLTVFCCIKLDTEQSILTSTLCLDTYTRAQQHSDHLESYLYQDVYR